MKGAIRIVGRTDRRARFWQPRDFLDSAAGRRQTFVQASLAVGWTDSPGQRVAGARIAPPTSATPAIPKPPTITIFRMCAWGPRLATCRPG